MEHQEIQVNSFVEKEAIKIENSMFIGKMIACSIAYLVVMFLLTQFRATAPIVLLWAMIAVQFFLYFSFFVMSYKRSIIFGLNKTLALVIFVILAIAGRVETWEVAILPLVVIIMIILSVRNKKLSEAGRNYQF